LLWEGGRRVGRQLAIYFTPSQPGATNIPKGDWVEEKISF